MTAPTATTCSDCGADLHKAAEVAASLCVRCYRDRQMDGYEIMQDGTRVPSTVRIRHGYNAVPCPCGQHYDLDLNGRCLACRASAGLWRNVAREARIDERDDAANDAAEEQEEQERDYEEWAAEQGEEIVGVGDE